MSAHFSRHFEGDILLMLGIIAMLVMGTRKGYSGEREAVPQW